MKFYQHQKLPSDAVIKTTTIRTFIKVDPKYTSQECSKCCHISKNNRKTQSEFECQNCGHTANADYGAAKVILRRGLSVCRQREALACA